MRLGREENRRSWSFRLHEKRGAGQRQGVGMGAPTPGSEDGKPEPRFSDQLSRFSKRPRCFDPRGAVDGEPSKTYRNERDLTPLGRGATIGHRVDVGRPDVRQRHA
jgi:hypothetical protein